ncbi:MAG: TlpA disulfide reductase family protein [Candidatus Poribacteria bacterium]|nr:TlpA disulfide reductase family protein [Candidatus Poribacteria bacterium]
MSEKYDSTDYWYTFINSFPNKGFSLGIGEMEMEEEIQEKLLAYLKEKIEEGVIDDVTTLPPRMYDYFWRFPKEILTKLRALAEGFLETDPDNAAAMIILTIVAGWERDPEYLTYRENMRRLAPNDPVVNLIIIDEFHRNGSLSGKFDGLETFLNVLENLYEWAKNEGETDRYQDVKSAYNDIGRSPGTPYGRAKKKLLDLKEEPEDPTLQKERSDQIEKCKTRIERCLYLFRQEHAAFNKELLKEPDEQQDFGDPTSDKIDFWETYLNSLDDKELSSRNWKLTPTIQEQLLKYFKMRIEMGVVDGKTTLPSELKKYISRFPRIMRIELREFAEDILEKHPNNGAAAKLLAIIVDEKEFPYLNQAIELLPNDTEICFLAYKQYDNPFAEQDFSLFERTIRIPEMLFARTQQEGSSALYDCIVRLYKDMGSTPCQIYRTLMQHPEGNTELIERCIPLINQAEQAFQKRLEEHPDDWYALRGLGDIYETLGETELAEKYPWEPHPEFKWKQKAWVGRQLPNFTATTLDGKSISFSDYRGKLVLLNFCAKWCGFCKPEIPHIKQAYDEHHNNGFEVIGISLDKSEAELREYIEEYDIPWIQIFDGKVWKSELAQYFGVNSVPSHWLIDRNGRILSVNTREERLVQQINWIESSRVGNIIPEFSAVDIDGNTVSPSTFRGKVVLLYLGFPEQIAERLNPIYAKYHPKGFDVFGISIFVNSSEDELRAKVRENKFSGQFIYDGDDWKGPLARQFGITFARLKPTMLLIDKNGKILMSRYEKVHSPGEWWAKLEELVSKHL